MSGRRSPLGHNGGPPLDDEAKLDPPGPHYCKYCRHWSPPLESETRDYEQFQLGLSRRRVKRPAGACDRVLMRPGGLLSFAATTDTFGCLNFSARPPVPIQPVLGFVTVYEGDRIVWKGHEEDLPDGYR